MTAMVDLLESHLRTLRRWAHVAVPHGRSPEIYRRLVRAAYRRMVYDPKTQIAAVRKGEQ